MFVVAAESGSVKEATGTPLSGSQDGRFLLQLSVLSK